MSEQTTDGKFGYVSPADKLAGRDQEIPATRDHSVTRRCNARLVEVKNQENRI
jgi:hypothetical protein